MESTQLLLILTKFLIPPTDKLKGFPCLTSLVQVLRCTKQVWVCKKVGAYNRTNSLAMPVRTSAPLQCLNTPMFECTPCYMFKHGSVQTWECSNMGVFKHWRPMFEHVLLMYWYDYTLPKRYLESDYISKQNVAIYLL